MAAGIVNLQWSLPWNEQRRWALRPLDRIDRAIVHQSLGHRDESGNRDVYGINRYHITPGPQNHISSKGAPHICYHYVIDDDGTIYLCNPLCDVVWHCRGQNERSIGVLVLGDFSGPTYDGDETPTKAQEKAVFKLVDHLRSDRDLGPLEFFGHCDFGKINCPGDVVYQWVLRAQQNKGRRIIRLPWKKIGGIWKRIRP